MKTPLLAAVLFLSVASAQIKLPAGIEAVAFGSAEVTFKGTVTRTVLLEAAISPQQSERGLMYRTSMAKDAGMLFVLGMQDRAAAFWMKNTLIPLDIAFFNSRGVIVDVLQMQPCKASDENCATYPSSKPVVGAIEMNLGWFKKNHIKVGDKVSFKMKY
ncbi:DUF192 domain-containing protein [Deinococcus roseus]|uniref:DUF192 domain-containing protein n=1 Tax=Deinococcus roseus TaxID=392414 RepID=A0ABQ2D0X2_9DEIO|nr:DUF192 domain-containing protein [Deinococcus roseus]GGJ40105.1 hypothetical protein GCM10008938_27630 [Deinococcus roseus]